MHTPVFDDLIRMNRYFQFVNIIHLEGPRCSACVFLCSKAHLCFCFSGLDSEKASKRSVSPVSESPVFKEISGFPGNQELQKMVFKSEWLVLGVYIGFWPSRKIQKSKLHLHAQLESLQILSCLLSRVIALVILAVFVLCERQQALPAGFKTQQGKTWSY